MAQQQRISYKLGYLIVFLGAVFYCYEYFLRIAPAVMKLQLMQSFKIDATLFGALSGAYFYAYTPLQLIVGVIVDRYKLRYVLTIAVLSCTLGSLILASTHILSVAMAGRFLQGIGSAFAFIGALKLAAVWLPAERFAFFAGACASLGFLGAAGGEIVLSHWVSSLGWRGSIQFFTYFGIVLAVLFWIFLRRRMPTYRTPAHHMDDTPAAHLTLHEAMRQLWSLLKKPYIWVAGVISYLMYLPTSVFAALWGIPYLQSLHHYSDSRAALATSMIFIGWAIGAPIQGWISDYFNNRIKIIFVGALMACILSIIALYVASLPFVVLCTVLVFFGIFSSVQVLTFAMARDMCSPQVAGMAIAFVNALAMIGGFIFQRGIGEILDWSWSGTMAQGVRVYTTHDYEHALIIVPIVLFLAAIVALIVRYSSIQKRMDVSRQPKQITFNHKH